ncbi:MAG: indolepyruvate ferredoxin oxidoreductase subunit alpha [Deltaproteobacteria bacterium]|nr:indolepyruvate ferredoxin oxidoreductase subunit alpha [Deltaproteobacteria bacterium]
MKKILLGNEAIARGLLENGCSFAASYPGTPASEILSSFLQMAKAEKTPAIGEWSINEKVAFETALSVSYAGGRAAVSMKQVGLNVACDPLMSSAYTGVKGGFLVISADDPGPHSSQTEQDSRMMAVMAKIPVLDPSTPQEAKEMIGLAYQISEEFEIPVMLRPTTRICHSRQGILLKEIPAPSLASGFSKDPQRWAATPRYRFTLHLQLNQKIEAIAEKFGKDSFRKILGSSNARRCIISSGVALAYTYDILQELNLKDEITLYQVKMPYPLKAKALLAEIGSFEDILIIEETYPVIEMQLAMRGRLKGRLDGSIPSQGELVPDVLVESIRNFAGIPEGKKGLIPGKARRPTLCPGCPHRPAFYAIRQALPQGIYPSDIGCYTLGLNLGAVDTVLCMGAAISQAAGLYYAYRMNGEAPPIVATIGDSTFYHAGIPALINAVHNGAKFILLILDNSTTAMTGNQPTPGLEMLADGRTGKAVAIEEIVRASGVQNLTILDPYQLESMIQAVKEADKVTRSEDGGISVIISRHPCLMNLSPGQKQKSYGLEITGDCIACEICYRDFECPAISLNPQSGMARIDQNLCSGCGVCVQVCPQNAIKNNNSPQRGQRTPR